MEHILLRGTSIGQTCGLSCPLCGECHGARFPPPRLVSVGTVISFSVHHRKKRQSLLAGLLNSRLPSFPRLIQDVEKFRIATPYGIYFDYLAHLGGLESEPYRWMETRGTISCDPTEATFSASNNHLQNALTSVMQRRNPDEPTNDWYDTVMHELCRFWRPDKPIPIPYSIIQYLNNRNSDTALNSLLTRFEIGPHLWSSFRTTLAHGPTLERFTLRIPRHVLVEDVKRAMWHVSRHTTIIYRPALYEPVLKAAKAVPDPSPIVFSLNAMVKVLLVDGLRGLYSAAM
ncbi:hypothetical protein B0H19DRAFT_1196309, partial [Mycena capillaripes]